ncbi:3-hydroxyacyl-CoA dehydrogenase NAD-binding domain-containing protein [Neorhizobium alkalisoli]|uniref:3-hydroxyacyl-CoA dehydrogenase n=1 Tax=Neorhizobium alkalisoli TaxID=528178 RepID=A0A561Q814_9HYPH|nr:3-hydroxyacyl-CoA dehydrogenase NAD-binding domain-containing protein [Neorhizobium alkalisoli]TWF46498.1 3-hydroxyacyl-CoA dehydrogenase [Neorhizobium alkalisoli]
MSQSLQTARIEMREAADGRTIAIVVIDHPPVNAGSHQMRSDLLHAFERLRGHKNIAGVVLTGANENFVAGSDIREFDAPPVAPHLPDVIAAIEAFPHPVIAAIDGAALGGGYELALGCDMRIATKRSVVGLPEVSLGLVPGAGGTQRLPRLVGIAKAITLITSARRVKAEEAKSLGMIDELVEGDVVSAAIAILPEASKAPIRDRGVIRSSEEEIQEATADALKKARGSKAAAAAIDIIKSADQLPIDEALAQERAASLETRVGEQSKALRHLFFAERVVSKAYSDVKPRPVRTVGIVGFGPMGRGIALAFASRGFSVIAAEASRELLGPAMDLFRKDVRALVDSGRLASEGDITERVSASDIDGLAPCDLIVEAITENMDAKKSVFARLADIAPDAILASNTSYLDINEIASVTARPERVAGLHFFNPANVMRLVEVIWTKSSSPETIATLMAVAKKLGKIAVPAQVAEGFIGNRIFSAYRQQCEFLIEDGAYPEEIDRAMREFGMAMGPFAVFDLAGLDIAWATRKRLAPTRNPRERYVDIADRLCEAGRFGRKTGKGWYNYQNAPGGEPDPAVNAIIEEASARKRIVRRSFSTAEIQSRLMAAIVYSAAEVLASGIAERSSDIDLALVNGFGFPSLKGGPLHWAANQPRAEILESIEAIRREEGTHRKAHIDIDAMLQSLLPAVA